MARKTIAKITVKFTDGTSYEIQKGLALGFDEEAEVVSFAYYNVTLNEVIGLLKTALKINTEEISRRFQKKISEGNSEEGEQDG